MSAGRGEEDSAEADDGASGSASSGFPRVAEAGRRLLQRYIGACNVQTDIKEAAFLGDNDELVAAGAVPH